MSVKYFSILGLGSLSALTIFKLIRNLYQDENICHLRNFKGKRAQRRILVLGLAGAGKSRLVQCFQPQNTPDGKLETPSPTFGYNVVSTSTAGMNFHFFEGGVSGYWDLNVDAMVWVVDSSSPETFLPSRQALHNCVSTMDQYSIDETKDDLAVYSLGIPIILVAAKQDVPGRAKPEVILTALEVDPLRSLHKVYIVGTEIPDEGERKGLWRLYELIAFSEKKHSIAFPPDNPIITVL